MVRETDDFEIVHLAVRDVGGQLVRKRLLLRRVDLEVEGMHIAHQRALRVGEVGNHAVVGIRARKTPYADSSRNPAAAGDPTG